MSEEQQPAFAAQRIYLKDASYEAPNAPGIFLKEWDPQVKVDMDNSVTTLNDSGVYEVQLKVTVTATVGEETAYIAEVVQGGIFLVTGFSDEDRKRLTGSVCPDMLYPYAREALSSLMTRGSFPAFLLSPVNFDYIYGKRLEENQQDEAEATSAET